MSVARNLASLLDSGGDVIASALDNVSAGGSEFQNITQLTGSGTFTIPSGTEKIVMLAIGGGGGSTLSGGQGVVYGGPGGRALGYITGFTAGTNYSYSVGGSGSNGAANNGTSGGSTSIFGLTASGGGRGSWSPKSNGSAGSFSDQTPDSGLTSITLASSNHNADFSIVSDILNSLGFNFTIIGINASSFADQAAFNTTFSSYGRRSGTNNGANIQSPTGGGLVLIY